MNTDNIALIDLYITEFNDFVSDLTVKTLRSQFLNLINEYKPENDNYAFKVVYTIQSLALINCGIIITASANTWDIQAPVWFFDNDEYAFKVKKTDDEVAFMVPYNNVTKIEIRLPDVN